METVLRCVISVGMIDHRVFTQNASVCLIVCLCSVHLLYDANFRTAVHARMEFNIPYHTIPYRARGHGFKL